MKSFAQAAESNKFEMMPHVTFVPLRDLQPDWFPVANTTSELRRQLRNLCARLGLISAAIYPAADDGFDHLSAPAVSVVANEALYRIHAEVETALGTHIAGLLKSDDDAWLVERDSDGKSAGQALVRRGRDGAGNTFVFVLSSPRAIDDGMMSELLNVIQGLLANPLSRVCGIGGDAEPEPSHQLSIRERECLTWTAEGKTSEEIAIILELSVHTVNHYLTSAARKLNAVNRLHAVARAMRLGLLKEVGASERAQSVQTLSKAHM